MNRFPTSKSPINSPASLIRYFPMLKGSDYRQASLLRGGEVLRGLEDQKFRARGWTSKKFLDSASAAMRSCCYSPAQENKAWWFPRIKEPFRGAPFEKRFIAICFEVRCVRVGRAFDTATTTYDNARLYNNAKPCDGDPVLT